MSGIEVANQMDNQRNNAASQFPSQLPGARLVSSPKEGNKENRCGEGAGVQLAGEAAPDLVK